MPENTSPSVIGPFVGFVDATSAVLWLHLPRLSEGEAQDVHVSLHLDGPKSPLSATGIIHVAYAELSTGTQRFVNLRPDTTYYYCLWKDATHSTPLDLEVLEPADLHFRTLPESGYADQLDFLLMSCHDPFSGQRHGLDGFAVWKALPQIIGENKNIRLAVMCGDQVYNDEVEKDLRAAPSLRSRQDLILGVYRKYWSDISYRKVLCSLPSVLMWDDHDITDGWGSREDSFTDAKADTFTPEWTGLFEAAKSVFAKMQASRNPPALREQSFDTCFRIGRAGFILADLRSNRNVRKKQIWLPEQLDVIKSWVASVRNEIDTVFFVSSVVFSHGDPKIDQATVASWGCVLQFFTWLRNLKPKCRFWKWLLRCLLNLFDRDLGDLRDDINDSWGAEVNAQETDRVLDFLFALQNPASNEKPLNVVILSGDIHTPGYSTLFSSNEDHRRAAIPHIVATPVSYQPFSWFVEAIYRHLTKVVKLGEKGIYTAQISHHFCHRNVVVVSLRNFDGDENHLKVKYYLEGFSEPQVLVFDLKRGSHREFIAWSKESQESAQVPTPA